ncbi:uncharacterized protein LOC120195521 [Hibiscus syriacus]|uniref:uncharacterized protein LOC120195521 n=1 Tax=Hibiscus syriacus TaxID=106335 RepID=UPI0019249BE6|nr:uncharacterized protein LOC120195521 [Hibiscus syriacus]
MKEVLSKKRKLGGFEIVALTEGYSTMATSRLPPKLKDPRGFTIPCIIGYQFEFRSGEVRHTAVTLQLDDRSTVHPCAIMNNMLVRVDKFIIPIDFIILDCKADKDEHWNECHNIHDSTNTIATIEELNRDEEV